MKRIVLAAFTAALVGLFSGNASAQPTWAGVMQINKEAAGDACNDHLGQHNRLLYRPYLAAGDTPSAIDMELFGASIYMQNNDATSQFQGTGTFKGTLIIQVVVSSLKNAAGTYNITLDPATVTADTTKIEIPNATVTVNVTGIGKCIFKFRGILMPAPAVN